MGAGRFWSSGLTLEPALIDTVSLSGSRNAGALLVQAASISKAR